MSLVKHPWKGRMQRLELCGKLYGSIGRRFHPAATPVQSVSHSAGAGFPIKSLA